MTTTPHYVFIKPDWQPMETAPKDGTVIRLAVECAQTWIDDTRVQYQDAFWGKMTAFPDREVWVDNTNHENGLVSDGEFVRQVSLYDYQTEPSYYYRGQRIIGWTYPWEVKIDIEYPKVAAPQYTDEVYDHRKKG